MPDTCVNWMIFEILKSRRSRLSWNLYFGAIEMDPANQLWEMLMTWFARGQWLLHYLLCSGVNVTFAGKPDHFLFLTQNKQQVSMTGYWSFIYFRLLTVALLVDSLCSLCLHLRAICRLLVDCSCVVLMWRVLLLWHAGFVTEGRDKFLAVQRCSQAWMSPASRAESLSRKQWMF